MGKSLKRWERVLLKESGWNIAVLRTKDLFHLPDPHLLPTFHWRNIRDCRSKGVEDPFWVEYQKKLYLFFGIECRDRDRERQVIGVAEYRDGLIQYRKIVLREEYTLSYPFGFSWEGEYYLLPESPEIDGVYLYRATQFPDKWEKVGRLLEGKGITAPTLYHREGVWYLFCSNLKANTLHLYWSEKLLGPYKPHPLSPLRTQNLHFSKPAGPIFEYRGTTYRVAQECQEGCGLGLHFLRIEELTPTSYRESYHHSILPSPYKIGWSTTNLHHFAPWKLGVNNWLVAIDGKGFLPRWL
jgi:hypothetical protein